MDTHDQAQKTDLTPDAGSTEITPFAHSQWVRSGKVSMGILMWALGVPIPLILIFMLVRGCS